MKIKCWSCKRVVAETTDKYDPAKRLNGSMITVAEPYKSRGWAQDMNWNVGTGCSELFCPECAYPLAPSGQPNFMMGPNDKLLLKFVCHKCTAEFLTLDELAEHKAGCTETPPEYVKSTDKFICNICGFQAKSNAGLISHQRSKGHTND